LIEIVLGIFEPRYHPVGVEAEEKVIFSNLRGEKL